MEMENVPLLLLERCSNEKIDAEIISQVKPCVAYFGLSFDKVVAFERKKCFHIISTHIHTHTN